MDSEIDSGVPSKYGNVCIRKERRKRQKIIAIELFFDFAKNTTLHGLRYVAERGLSLVEKLFWLFTFVISVSLCFYLIHKVWIKWQTYPVLVTFNEQLVPVNMVPFPSVTICPQAKCLTSNYNYTEQLVTMRKLLKNNKLNETSMKDIEKLEDVKLICKDWKKLLERNVSDHTVVENIMEVSPDLDQVFFYCEWRDRDMRCDSLFKTVLTGEGVCYNFNSLSADEIFKTDVIQNSYKYLHSDNKSVGWSIENGYVTSTKEYSYPRRGRENGRTPDLQVILLQSKSNNDKSCNSLNSGYKIYLHNPADLPHDSLYYYAALDGQVSSLAVKVSMLNTSDSLKGYPSEVRQCYFSTERKLKYFRIYTANNCMLECHSNRTYKRCNCVGFNMPHDNNTAICTIKMQRCMVKVINQVARIGLASACSCLPLCDSVQYDAEILKTEFKFKEFFLTTTNIDKKLFQDYDAGFSSVELFFKEPRFVSTRRSELFGNVDFLANCGGLLGLFLGFSFLSLVEMFYFLTLRLWCTLRRDLREEKAERKKGIQP